MPPASIKTEDVDMPQAAVYMLAVAVAAVEAAAASLEDEGSLQPSLLRDEEDSEATQVGCKYACVGVAGEGASMQGSEKGG